MGKSTRLSVAIAAGMLVGTFLFGCDSLTGPGPDYGEVRNLTGEYDGTTVHLTWDPTESGEEIGYEIQRDYETLAEVPKKQQFYDDDTVSRDNVYDYIVYTVYERGKGYYERVIISTWSYHLWVGAINRVIKVTPDDGTVVGTVDTPWSWLSGLTTDGTDLWIVESWDNVIYKFDADTGETLSSFDSPCDYPTGLAWDGEHLWNVGYYGEIFKIDPGTGGVVESFIFDEYDWKAVTYDGEYLWLAELYHTEPYDIYRINPETGEATYAFRMPNGCANGLTWDGANLWGVNDDLLTAVNPDTGKTIISFDAPSGSGDGLTFRREEWD